MASLEGMSKEAIEGLARIAKGLSENPETRPSFLAGVKRINPGTPIPEIDIPVQLQAHLKPLQDQVQALQTEIAQRDAVSGVARQRDEVIERGLLTKGDIPEVEKLMVEKGIASYETAADHLRMSRQTATPTPAQYSGRQEVPQLGLKELGGDRRTWARNTAVQALNDIRSGRIAV